LFGYHGIDYGIYLDFYDFQPMLNLISFWYRFIFVNLGNEIKMIVAKRVLITFWLQILI
jgi:hypothetical protein